LTKMCVSTFNLFSSSFKLVDVARANLVGNCNRFDG
jgi:hypothetical protein